MTDTDPLADPPGGAPPRPAGAPEPVGGVEFKRPRGRRGRIPGEEYNRRVAAVAKMLARRHLRSEIHTFLKRLFDPDISERTCAEYVARARVLLRDRYTGTDDPAVAGATAEQLRDLHRCSSFALYESILRDGEASNAERLAAQAAIDRLLGLNAPIAVDPGTDRLAELRQNALASAAARELMAVMAERLGGLQDPLPDGSLPEHQPAQLPSPPRPEDNGRGANLHPDPKEGTDGNQS